MLFSLIALHFCAALSALPCGIAQATGWSAHHFISPPHQVKWNTDKNIIMTCNTDVCKSSNKPYTYCTFSQETWSDGRDMMSFFTVIEPDGHEYCDLTYGDETNQSEINKFCGTT